MAAHHPQTMAFSNEYQRKALNRYARDICTPFGPGTRRGETVWRIPVDLLHSLADSARASVRMRLAAQLQVQVKTPGKS